MARLTYQQRKKMGKKSFAIPSNKNKGNKAGRGAYPIPDISHARKALARVSAYGTPAEKKRVKTAVYKKYPGLKKRAQKRSK